MGIPEKASFLCFVVDCYHLVVNCVYNVCMCHFIVESFSYFEIFTRLSSCLCNARFGFVLEVKLENL